MSAAVYTLILTVSTLCGATAESGALGGPTNVRLTSYNMDLVLRWDPPAGASGDLVYTTEYRNSFSNYSAGCLNASAAECDFSQLSHISIYEYGKYMGRVRAQQGAQSSVWVESKQIIMDSDTTIGAPNVTLITNGATLDVSIKDPVFRISTLKEVYSLPTYNVTYWKDGEKEKAKSFSNIQQNRMILPDLDMWTTYCVQVLINTRNPKPSKPSRPVCEKTTKKEETPWVTAVVTFVVVAQLMALLVIAVVYRKRISHFLCPKDSLPQHFKEDLLACPKSSMYLAMQNSHPLEEIYDLVKVIADDETVEEGHPLEATESNCSKDSEVTAEQKWIGERTDEEEQMGLLKK